MSLTLFILGGAAAFLGGGAWLIRRQINREVAHIRNFTAVEQPKDDQWRTFVSLRMAIVDNSKQKRTLQPTVYGLQVKGLERRLYRISIDSMVNEEAMESLFKSSDSYVNYVLPWLEGTYSHKKLATELKSNPPSNTSATFKVLDDTLYN